MNSRKVYYIMIGVLVVLIGLLFTTVVLGNRYLKKQSDKLVAAKLDQKSLNEQQTALIKAKKDLQKYNGLLQIAKGIVPQDKDQARAVREIVQYASQAGVTLESITFDDSTLGQQSSTAAPAASSGGEAAAPSSSSSTKLAVTQAKPVTGMPGVYSVPIEIVSTKSNNQFNNFSNFLSLLENNRRTAQVKKVTIVRGKTAAGVEYINFALTVNIYVKP